MKFKTLKKNYKEKIEFQDDKKREEGSQALSAREFIDEQLALLQGRIKESSEFEYETNNTDDITEVVYDAEPPENESSYLYEMSVSLAKETHVKAASSETLECEPINSCVDDLAEQLTLNNNFLPVLMSGVNGDYLSSHAVNVCILSMKIGIGIGYDKSKLTELGTSAFLHDIGMTKYLELSRQARKLTIKESEEIKNHPVIGSELLKKAKGLPEIAIHVTLQQHERIDGSGYPYGLKGESLDPYAKIINLADTYEAVTHSRSYRDKFEPFGAMNEILSSKTSFDYDVLKSFINTVGIFPMGSLVKLNTGETCKVAKINQGSPTRPVLHMLYNNENHKLEKMKVIDLLKQPILYINECLTEVEGVEN